MEPAIVAAMISAGVKIGTWLFDKWTGQPSQRETIEYVTTHYNTLRALVTNNCMRILRRLEDGQNRSASALLEVLYPGLEQMGPEEAERLRSEFDYRLFFLALSGLITRPLREFYITPTGVEFVRQAREKRDFMEVLHQ